jgi:hypothetical protein
VHRFRATDVEDVRGWPLRFGFEIDRGRRGAAEAHVEMHVLRHVAVGGELHEVHAGREIDLDGKALEDALAIDDDARLGGCAALSVWPLLGQHGWCSRP